MNVKAVASAGCGSRYKLIGGVLFGALALSVIFAGISSTEWWQEQQRRTDKVYYNLGILTARTFNHQR